jgi:hypothetical protein
VNPSPQALKERCSWLVAGPDYVPQRRSTAAGPLSGRLTMLTRRAGKVQNSLIDRAEFGEFQHSSDGSCPISGVSNDFLQSRSKLRTLCCDRFSRAEGDVTAGRRGTSERDLFPARQNIGMKQKLARVRCLFGASPASNCLNVLCGDPHVCILKIVT